MNEQETQETQATQETQESGEEREESFTVGGMTYHGPLSMRNARLQLAVEQFRSQVDWLTGYLFIVGEHFESRDDSIPALTVIGYLDEVPTVAADLEGALDDVEHLAADLRRVMAGEGPDVRRPLLARCMADVSPRFDERKERSYRRGYQHGWFSAVDGMLRLLRAGRKPEEAYRACDEFGSDDLSVWRFGDCTRLEMPPTFDEEAQGAG